MNKGMVTDFGEKWEESFQGFFLYWLGRFGSVNLWGSCVVSYCVWGRDSEMPWRRKTHHSLAAFVVESWSFYGAVISINFFDRWISNKKPLLLWADYIWERQEQFLSILLLVVLCMCLFGAYFVVWKGQVQWDRELRWSMALWPSGSQWQAVSLGVCFGTSAV